MYDDLYLDDFERYLATAPILDIATFELHGAHRSWRLILEGGVGVLAKPEDVIGDGPAMVRKEAAAWLIAREMGWPDLMAVTVLREIASPENPDQRVGASVQVLWPDIHPDADRNSFSDADVWRAAVFDAVVGHTDRSGHNWLAVPGSALDRASLKLVDHGYAFTDALGPPSSSFYEMRRGQELPSSCIEGLERLVHPRHFEVLETYLASSAQQSMFARVSHLLDARKLDF